MATGVPTSCGTSRHHVGGPEPRRRTFAPPRTLSAGGVPLLFDFDNDGALDLLLADPKGSTLWRNGGSGDFSRVEAALPGALAAEAFDADGDGDPRSRARHR
jgi:hypothetical protein